MVFGALIPWKFLALLAHVIATAALLYMMFTPIQVSLPAPARTRRAVKTCPVNVFIEIGPASPQHGSTPMRAGVPPPAGS